MRPDAGLAAPAPGAHTGRVPAPGGYSFAYGPIVAFAVVGILVLLLRWTFQRGHSLVASPARRGAPSDYGLLVAVAAPTTFAEAELIRARLQGHGVRATLAPTTEGPRVLVFGQDAALARALVNGPH